MLSTRSKGEASLTKFTDNPERIGKEKPKKKIKKMADAGTPETTQQLDTGDKNHTPNPEDNEDKTQNIDPIYEMYLPDLNNTPLSQALKTGLDYRMEDEVIVECPKQKQYFGVDTFLVQRISGWICIYTDDGCESFPINCSRTKFTPSLLEKALKGAEKQRATPKDLPGEDWLWKIKTVLGRIQLDKRLDAYADLVSRYARNSVSLEHANMVNRGTDSGYLKVAKLELRARKIANRMDKIVAVMMQDNAYRQQAQFKMYPTPTINPINQMISSPAETDKITAATMQEAEEIMAIAYPSGTEPPVAVTDNTITQTTQAVIPTNTTVTTAADRLDCRRAHRPASPTFTMNVAMDNCLGATANPLLIVNTGNNGNTNSFITMTLAMNCQNCQDNQNTITFDNNIPKADKRINARLVEIASQGPGETTATNHHDRPIPDRH